MDAHRGIAQTRARHGLPGALHRELLDLFTQPVQTHSRTDVEIDPGRLGDADLVSCGHLDDVERCIMRAQAGDARR